MYGGILKKYLYTSGANISRSGSPICFSMTKHSLDTVPFKGWGNMYLMSVWSRGGCGRMNGGTRVITLALNSREAALRKGARCTSTSLLKSSRPHGGVTR
jgi:hypothetical protein